jgi:hypothetical protein
MKISSLAILRASERERGEYFKREKERRISALVTYGKAKKEGM